MSGTVTPPADASVPADRVAFRELITSGRPNLTQATRLLNCQLPMPIELCYLLELSETATFAQGAAKLIWRFTNGGGVY